MAPEIPLDKQRPAEYVFARHVDDAMAKIKEEKEQPSPASAPRQRSSA